MITVMWFFPVAASVFQIQSVFIPSHKPLLIRRLFCSNHPAYLDRKVSHCSDPPGSAPQTRQSPRNCKRPSPAHWLLRLLESQLKSTVKPRKTRKGNEIVTPPLLLQAFIRLRHRMPMVSESSTLSTLPDEYTRAQVSWILARTLGIHSGLSSVRIVSHT